MNLLKNKHIINIFLITTIGALARITIGLKWDGMLFDEMVSVFIAKQPLYQMWEYLKWEMHPPLHYIYLHFWMNIFGNNETSLRFSTILISILNIPLIFALTKKIFKSHNSALLVSFFTAVSTYQIYFSTWIRMYSLLFFLSLLSFLIFIKALQENKKHLWILLTLINTLAIYTHLTAVFIFIIEVLYVLYIKFIEKNHIKIANLTYSFTVSFLLFTPWLYNFILTRLSLFPSNSWYFWAQKIDVYFLNIPIRFQYTGVNNNIIMLIGFILVVATFIFLTTNINIKNRQVILTSNINHKTIFPIITLFTPLIVFFSLNINTTRFMYIASIGAYIMFGVGLYNIIQKTKLNTKLVYLFFISVSLVSFSYIYSIDYSPKWDKITKFIDTNSSNNELILTAHPFQMMPLYLKYKDTKNYQSYIPEKIKEKNTVINILQTNFYPTISEKNVYKINKIIGKNKKIFFIMSEEFYKKQSKIILDYLLLNGWSVKKKYKSNNFTKPQILLMEKL